MTVASSFFAKLDFEDNFYLYLKLGQSMVLHHMQSSVAPKG